MPRCTGDKIVPTFRQNFVKVTLDALMNGECGISATYSAVGERSGSNEPLIREASSGQGQPSSNLVITHNLLPPGVY